MQMTSELFAQDVYAQRSKLRGADDDLTLRVSHNLGVALVANGNKDVSAYGVTNVAVVRKHGKQPRTDSLIYSPIRKG